MLGGHETDCDSPTYVVKQTSQDCVQSQGALHG